MTDGDAFELVRNGLFARTKLTWALARDIAERAAERAEAAPSRLKRDLGDREIRLAKKRRRPLDASREKVSMRRHTEGFFRDWGYELARKEFGEYTIAEQTNDRVVVRPTSGNGDDAMRMANDIYEGAHPAASSVRFVQFVPKPSVIRS